MTDTFYLHLESKDKNGWSINLPFLCTKCGNCCRLEDFLSSGKINAAPEEHSKVHTEVKKLFEDLGRIWEADESEYEDYITQNYCPLLVNKSCSIYEIRPDGCRRFPLTAFGMLSQDCEPLTHFKKQRSALKKGKTYTETYYFTEKASSIGENSESIKPAKITQKQLRTCIAKLRQAGITNDELILFNRFNE